MVVENVAPGPVDDVLLHDDLIDAVVPAEDIFGEQPVQMNQ